MSDAPKPLSDSSPDEILDAVTAIVRKVAAPCPVPTDEAVLDTDLFESGILDSLGWIRLLDELEDAYGVELDIEVLDEKSVTSMRDIAAYLAEATAPSRIQVVRQSSIWI